MERVPGRVEPDVGADRPARGQPLRQPGRGRVEDAPPVEVVEERREARSGVRGGRRRSSARHRVRTVSVEGPVRAARSGVHSPHGIVPAVNADQPLPEAAPSPSGRQAPPARQRRREVRRGRHPPDPVHDHRCCSASRAPPRSSPATRYLSKDLPDPKQGARGHRVRPADRRSTTAPARCCSPGSARTAASSCTFDQIPPELMDATTSIEDKTFWENSGFDPDRLRLRGHRHAPGQRSRRLDDHPAARPRPPPARRGHRARRRQVPAQAARDHPVDPADRGLPGRRRASS